MMKINGLLTAVFTGLLIILAACTTATEPVVESSTPDDDGDEVPTAAVAAATAVPVEVTLPDLGEAPEILNDVWINTDVPVTLASQRGKVVLLEFWTFG